MADNNVIRRDVIEVSWKIDNSGLKKLTDSTKKLKDGIKGTQQDTENSFQRMAKSANKVKSALTPLNDKINQLGRSAVNAGKQFATGFGRVAKKAVLGLGTAISALSVSAIKNYADYEQLVGGVETLFKNSKGVVMDYAKNAYKTAGLSANAYMETVTSFSASLLQSLDGDTVKAAKVADRAIIDMADNANKMGTDMGSIQYAYQGFAKQNYTMLDNLKLGYGGTQEEMKRLINDASKMKDVQKELGITVDGSSMSFANIVNAISVMQSKMGISGTTAKEASSTIQGSISAMKGAWTNLMTGLADPSQDFDQLLKNFIQSVVTVGKNLLPRIKTVLTTLKDELAPAVSSAVQNIALKAREYLIANKDKIWDGFKTIMATGINMIYQLFTGESLNLEEVKAKIQGVVDKVTEFVNKVKENLPAIKATIIGVAIAIGVLKAAIFACNAIIAINNGIMKAKQAIDIACAAKAKILTAAQWAMNTSIMGCPVLWLVAGIVALIAIIVLLVKNWDKVKAAGVKCWEAIKGAWANVSSWFDSKIVQPVKNAFSNLWDNVCDGASAALDKVKTAWGSIKGWFADIWKGTVKAVAKPVNKLIGGANWVLEKVGSDKKLAEWQPYAKGTNGHRGGNAIVNDGRGAELVQMPNGRMFIPRGRNVLMPNAPRGMKVLNAERTAQLMGRGTPTFNYAGGIGDWAIWDFFDNAKGLVQKVIEKFVSWKDMAGYPLDVAKGVVSTATSKMTDWVKGLFKKHGGKDLSSYVASAGVEQWRSTVVQALKMEGLYSEANVKRTLHQMQTESGGNPKAINNWDVNARKGTPSKGLMQVIDPTFKAYARKGFASNIYDPLSNILASVRYATARYGSLEKAYRGVGYANGIGNFVVPTYTPASSVPVSSSSHSNTNNYAPSFTLNMSGTVDRTTERTIKRWVQEALEDMFDSMSRTNPRLTEV